LPDKPPVMSDGNWRVGLIMDAAASPEQAEKPGAVLAGQVGGPMAMVSPLISEVLGMETVPIDYVDDRRLHSVKVGERSDRGRDRGFRAPSNPDGGVEGLTGMFHPANSTLTIAKANRSRVEAFGLSFANEVSWSWRETWGRRQERWDSVSAHDFRRGFRGLRGSVL
jgi:hypothetical protein